MGGIGKFNVIMIEGVDLMVFDFNGEFSDIEVELGFLIVYCCYIV